MRAKTLTEIRVILNTMDAFGLTLDSYDNNYGTRVFNRHFF
jgi:hypothetical protein